MVIHWFLRYAVSVAAFNGAGPGPYSVPLFQDTREGGKLPLPLPLPSTGDLHQNYVDKAD